MTEYNIEVIKKEDKEFPWYLGNIENPPEALYCIGDVTLLSKQAVAVIGARKCSEYGRQMALKVGRLMARNNVVTVSGMAAGIDSFAHVGAIEEKGSTIGVLGCGPDICYPKSNRRLYDNICNEGLIISEYPPGTQPKPWQFPRRNRIISALAQVVVVVEAGTGSGSLITAVAAAEQGKEVMAVPGNISSIFSMGTNKLIQDGANIITVPEDILRAMGLNPVIDKEDLTSMGNDELKIYKVLQEQGEVTMDFLCEALELEPFKVNGLVAIMEMKGIISYQLGKIFIAKF